MGSASDCQGKITAEPNRNLQQLLLTAEKQQKLVREEEKGKLESLKKIVNLHDAKSPDSVIAVFDLVTALNNYNGQISIGNNFFKLRMLHGLGSELKGYFESKQSSPDLLVFEKKCTKIINDNYKYLTMEIGLWNAIKEALKPVLVKLHIDTKRLLSSNDLIKNEKVYGMFHEVVTKGGIEITDEDQIDTKLNP
ncbi:hypothetical protein lpari_00545 [Legionella parisiensis]|uniref:Uncharacterized protein n=1 Tax=Legionella parisiensis TaxID=45071 RepID=A0A1E5JVF7_9GAMM|nr:hypothetical protein [Legionella parisiensis]OEH48470.1 hypothetical protein lpari_00545 [Legionella parisiensis]